MDAAWRVLLEVGPEQFSMDRVALEAHASKQTIYARFADKTALLRAVLSSRTSPIVAEMEVLDTSLTLEAAFVDLAERSIGAMVAVESQVLGRLLDWIDDMATETDAAPLGLIVHKQVHAKLRELFTLAANAWGVSFPNEEHAITFWLDGLAGHVRSRRYQILPNWPTIYTRYFLEAVIREAPIAG